uniref:Uncharacterized protein n=1 Tax=Anopheles coluzzii TaxID=1518534 RepID=A0A8W7P9R1_ANOCL
MPPRSPEYVFTSRKPIARFIRYRSETTSYVSFQPTVSGVHSAIAIYSLHHSPSTHYQSPTVVNLLLGIAMHEHERFICGAVGGAASSIFEPDGVTNSSPSANPSTPMVTTVFQDFSLGVLSWSAVSTLLISPVQLPTPSVSSMKKNSSANRFGTCSNLASASG